MYQDTNEGSGRDWMQEFSGAGRWREKKAELSEYQKLLQKIFTQFANIEIAVVDESVEEDEYVEQQKLALEQLKEAVETFLSLINNSMSFAFSRTDISAHGMDDHRVLKRLVGAVDSDEDVDFKAMVQKTFPRAGYSDTDIDLLYGSLQTIVGATYFLFPRDETFSKSDPISKASIEQLVGGVLETLNKSDRYTQDVERFQIKKEAERAGTEIVGDLFRKLESYRKIGGLQSETMVTWVAFLTGRGNFFEEISQQYGEYFGRSQEFDRELRERVYRKVVERIENGLKTVDNVAVIYNDLSTYFWPVFDHALMFLNAHSKVIDKPPHNPFAPKVGTIDFDNPLYRETIESGFSKVAEILGEVEDSLPRFPDSVLGKVFTEGGGYQDISQELAAVMQQVVSVRDLMDLFIDEKSGHPEDHESFILVLMQLNHLLMIKNELYHNLETASKITGLLETELFSNSNF